MLSLIFYAFPAKWLAGYEEAGRNGILILFAVGWSLSLGGFVFHLGIENQKKRKRESPDIK